MDFCITGILDNDHKGTTGRGTQHYMKISLDGVETTHTWFLMDVLEGKVKPNDFSKEYHDWVSSKQKEQQALEAQQKAQAKADREKSITVSDSLLSAVEAAIENPANSKALGEFQAGKERAINSVVGFVIKQIKERGETPPDALAILTAIKKTIGGLHDRTTI